MPVADAQVPIIQVRRAVLFWWRSQRLSAIMPEHDPDTTRKETPMSDVFICDAVRSPIDVYRGPGDPPYEGD